MLTHAHLEIKPPVRHSAARCEAKVNYSERCHFVFGRSTTYPCKLEKGHSGRHLDGYDMVREPEDRWYERTDYYSQFEELWERCEAANRADLLDGLKP